MSVLGGAGDLFVSWGAVLSVRDPTDKTTALDVTRRHQGVFGNLLAHRNRFRVAQLSYCAYVGGFTQVFRENRDLLVFGGVWALREIPGRNRQKKCDPQKSKKRGFFLVAVSKSNFPSKTERFVFVFSPWCPL